MWPVRPSKCKQTTIARWLHLARSNLRASIPPSFILSLLDIDHSTWDLEELHPAVSEPYCCLAAWSRHLSGALWYQSMRWHAATLAQLGTLFWFSPIRPWECPPLNRLTAADLSLCPFCFSCPTYINQHQDGHAQLVPELQQDFRRRRRLLGSIGEPEFVRGAPAGSIQPPTQLLRSNVAHQVAALPDTAASCELCRFLLRAKDAVLRHLKAKGCEWVPFTIDISWVIVTRGQVGFGMKPVGDGWVVDDLL